ncbi:MAG: hypothetical protein G01um101429_269 [Parcubacteria group bacterium Gr01-1014_29]|nr:MAG: hypothetical protein G01um101429_269 [Parcubacteria group bacterium Gr01-1014_29]
MGLLLWLTVIGIQLLYVFDIIAYTNIDEGTMLFIASPYCGYAWGDSVEARAWCWLFAGHVTNIVGGFFVGVVSVHIKNLLTSQKK